MRPPPRPSFLPRASGSGVRSGRSRPLASIASLQAGRDTARRPPLRSVLALICLLGARSAWGLGIESTAEELVVRASHVLLGTVTQLQSLRVGPGRLVCTLVRLQTEQSLKGPVQPGGIEILTPGGILPEEDLGVWFSEQARFQPGERVLVALERSPLGDGRWRVVNGAQGKVRVGRELRPRAAE